MDRIESAIQAAKDGDNDTARALLKELLEEDVDNERAWLWLSQVVESDAERRLCLQQVLRINPQNRGAQQGLAHLGSPVPGEEEPVAPQQPPVELGLTMRSVRYAASPGGHVAKTGIESPKAPARMPPAVATRRTEPRRPRFLPVLLGIAGVLAVVLVVFIVTTRMESGEPGTDVAAESTLAIRIVEETTSQASTAEPTSAIQTVEETPDKAPTAEPTGAPQSTEPAPTPAQPQPTEPAPTPTQPEPTKSPATPAPAATAADQPVATRSETDAAGLVDLGLHDGTTAEVRVVSSTGEPVAGSDVFAVSDSAGLSLVAVAPGYRPYVATWESDANSTTSLARAPSASEAPITIELVPETDVYMTETSVSLEGLLSLPDHAPGWEANQWSAGEVCAVLGSSGHAYRALLALAAKPSGPHFEIGFAGAADAEELCAQALPVPDLPGELTVIRSDDADVTLAAWNPGGEGILHGRVVGEDAQGVAGVTVHVAETGASATTLPHGWYYLPARETVTLTLSAEIGELSGGPLQVGAVAGRVVAAPPLEVVRTEEAVTETPSPEETLATYWQLVNEGRFDNAWVLLSSRFQVDRFGGGVQGFRAHYAEMGLCRVVAEEVRLLEQGAESAVVAARMLYETGSRCELDAFDFDFHFVYDADHAAWLLDDSVWQGVSQ
jgi:hypothetical protein